MPAGTGKPGRTRCCLPDPDGAVSPRGSLRGPGPLAVGRAFLFPPYIRGLASAPAR
jgi:hypothetical protein